MGENLGGGLRARVFARFCDQIVTTTHSEEVLVPKNSALTWGFRRPP